MQAADIGPVAPDARTQSALYDRRGPYAGTYGFAPAGVTAWMSGAVT